MDGAAAVEGVGAVVNLNGSLGLLMGLETDEPVWLFVDQVKFKNHALDFAGLLKQLLDLSLKLRKILLFLEWELLQVDVALGVNAGALGSGLEEGDDHLLLLEHLVVASSDALLGVLGLVVLDVTVTKGVALLIGLKTSRQNLSVLLETNLELLGCDRGVKVLDEDVCFLCQGVAVGEDRHQANRTGADLLMVLFLKGLTGVFCCSEVEEREALTLLLVLVVWMVNVDKPILEEEGV